MQNSEMVIACDLFVMGSVLLPSRRLKEAAADSFFGPLWPFALSSFQFAAVQESAFGTKQTYRSNSHMSAFGAKADIVQVMAGPLLTRSGRRRAEIPPRRGGPPPLPPLKPRTSALLRQSSHPPRA